MLQNLMLISVTLGGIFLIVMTIVKSRSRTDLIKKLSNPGFLDSEGLDTGVRSAVCQAQCVD